MKKTRRLLIGTLVLSSLAALPGHTWSRTAGEQAAKHTPKMNILFIAVTLAQHFMHNGYRVEGGGKIFHNSYNDPASWYAWTKEKKNPVPANTAVNGLANMAHFDRGPVDASDEEMGDHEVVSAGVDFLSRTQEKPFFLAIGLIRPHVPFYAPRKYFDQYLLEKIKLPKVLDNDLDDVPDAGRRMAKPEGDHRKVVEAKQWEKAVQAYLACISFADAEVGRLLDALDKSEHTRNTIIVLWSDHGWHLGEKQHWRKFTLWEEATRVTFMIVAPGVTKANTRSARTVNLMDIYPTLIDLCGLPKKPEIEAASLLPLLKNPQAKWERPSLTTFGRKNHTARSERWR
jgi:arylsulfatase A-like enzyme